MSDVTSHQGGEAPQNGFGGKDGIQEEFPNYMQPTSQQPNYGFPPNEPFYYGQMAFPSYMGGEWSTAGDSVSYMSAPYSNIGNGEPHRSFVQEPMFNQQTNTLGNGQPYFNAPVFQQGSDFNAWTSPTSHNTGLDVGHQSGASTYNGDFYHPILPSMQQDYLERNDYMNNSSIGSLPNTGHGQQAEFISGGFSGGDGINKMPGTSSSMHALEHGMQNLMTNASAESESVNAGKVGQPPINSVPLPDNQPQRVDYNNTQVPVKLNSVSNLPQPPPTNKPISWAAIASKPAKPQAKPKPKVNIGLPPPVKHSADSTNWDGSKSIPRAGPGLQPGTRNYGWGGAKAPNQTQDDGEDEESKSDKDDSKSSSGAGTAQSNHPVLDKLKLQNEYNPKRLTMDLRNSRFFVIKSYSEDDIHRSIKYNIWCSTEHGNKRLDATFRAQKNRGPVILLYSVNGSGHFCGVAEMKTCVDYSSRPGVWSQDKWKGQFQVKWIYVKDVPNTVLRHIRLENNDNKPVTNSRDTQEVPADKGRQVLKIIANYKHQTSIFDDFGHYERRQQEEEDQKTRAAQAASNRERKAGEAHTSYSVKNASAQ